MERTSVRYRSQYNRANVDRHSTYVEEGNTVRRLNEREAIRRERREYNYDRHVVKAVPGSTRKGIRKTTTINAGYVLFLTFAMCVTGYFCMNYLTMTSEITNDLSKIASLEAEYNSIKAENDDYDNRINGAVDLENIKKRAMNDLGMQYAEDDQIVTYKSDDTDYVRQYIALE